MLQSPSVCAFKYIGNYEESNSAMFGCEWWLFPALLMVLSYFSKTKEVIIAILIIAKVPNENPNSV